MLPCDLRRSVRIVGRGDRVGGCMVQRGKITVRSVDCFGCIIKRDGHLVLGWAWPLLDRRGKRRGDRGLWILRGRGGWEVWRQGVGVIVRRSKLRIRKRNWRGRRVMMREMLWRGKFTALMGIMMLWIWIWIQLLRNQKTIHRYHY